jgi:bifunctional ADP-heptose synthase (sugar kinase/adenylyltransferase)
MRDEHGWYMDIMCRGDDFQGVPPGTKFIEENGGKVVRVPYCSQISSTEIKKRIKKLYE